MPLTQLSRHSIEFPPIELALDDPNGLLALGGDLSPERLKNAYRYGIFPWFSPDEPILWWSPDPRAILYPDKLHVSRSMVKFLKRTRFRVTLNHAFEYVIHACASERDEGTWIAPQMQSAYLQLNHQGVAHSVEVWQEDSLIGGLYGIAQGTLFCGESMFSRQSNASKLALYAFCQHFLSYGGRLIDCQILNDHTASLGAIEIPRCHYQQLLSDCRDSPLPSSCWQAQELNVSSNKIP